MKKYLLINYIVGLLFLGACDKKELFPEHDAVEAKFELLNEEGKPTTIFNEGEDIIFDYRILNKTGEDLDFHPFNHNSDIRSFPIFTVYGASSKRKIGSVFEPYIFVFYPKLIVSPEEEIIIRATWFGNWAETTIGWGSIKYPDNKRLPKGEYIVQFEHKLRFFGPYQDFHADISVPFEVR